MTANCSDLNNELDKVFRHRQVTNEGEGAEMVTGSPLPQRCGEARRN